MEVEQTHITSEDLRYNKNDGLVLQLFKGAGESSMCFKVSKKERGNLKYVRHTDAIFKVTLTDQISQQDLIKKINSQRKKAEQNNPDNKTKQDS